MEQLHFSYQGQATISKIVRVGNVGSGDLEILLEPTDTATITINIITSVDNRSDIWHAIFNRHFSVAHAAMQMTINDFGATPGVIGLRLTQALEHLTEEPLTKPVLAQENASAAESPEMSGLLNSHSFIEMNARERARFLLDDGSFREIIGSEYHSFSPWLLLQGIVPQTDDGCVVAAKGTIDGKPSVVIGIDGTFQGGAIGEISGQKWPVR
ncbi:malonate decarboxylase acyl carrier protein [Vibrio sp. PP-XX7]